MKELKEGLVFGMGFAIGMTIIGIVTSIVGLLFSVVARGIVTL